MKERLEFRSLPRSMCIEMMIVGSTSLTPATPAFSSMPRLVQFEMLPVTGLFIPEIGWPPLSQR